MRYDKCLGCEVEAHPDDVKRLHELGAITYPCGTQFLLEEQTDGRAKFGFGPRPPGIYESMECLRNQLAQQTKKLVEVREEHLFVWRVEHEHAVHMEKMWKNEWEAVVRANGRLAQERKRNGYLEAEVERLTVLLGKGD